MNELNQKKCSLEESYSALKNLKTEFELQNREFRLWILIKILINLIWKNLLASLAHSHSTTWHRNALNNFIIISQLVITHKKMIAKNSTTVL